MNIQLLSAMYGRHEAVSIALESWRLDGLEPVMVVSTPEDIEFCKANDVEHTLHDNRPLSMKWQHGIDYIRLNKDIDAILMLGSDDTIEGSENYVKYLLQGYEFIGVGDLYVKDIKSGKIKHWEGYTNHRKGETAGAGRCLSWELLDRMNWGLWNIPREKGLDGILNNRILEANAKKITISSKEVKITDLKDSHSLTPFHRFDLPIINKD